jgi:peptidoglycan/LPS O-acetylase OafA/YrhL
MYLWHQAIMGQLHDSHWAWSLPFPILLTMLVGLTALAATVTYIAVERPFLRRRTQRQQSEAPAPGALATT